jgi:hypothetical protein
MTTSPRLGFTYLETGETVPETAVNEIAEITEAATGHFVLEDRDLSTPPGSPVAGTAYLHKRGRGLHFLGKGRKQVFGRDLGFDVR